MTKRRATVKFLEKKFKGKWVCWKNELGDEYIFKVRRIERASKESKYCGGWIYDMKSQSGYAARYAKVITKEQALALQL